MAAARDRLAAAEDNLTSGHLAVAASAAYYAMLYAARAALSEHDLYAKTHSGVWSLFSDEFVKGGDFDPGLGASAAGSQRIRELSDYEARPASAEEARELVALAGRFLRETERVLGA